MGNESNLQFKNELVNLVFRRNQAIIDYPRWGVLSEEWLGMVLEFAKITQTQKT